MNSLKKFISDPTLDLAKSVLIFYVIWFLYSSLNGEDFNWASSLAICFGVWVLATFLMVLSSNLTFNKNKNLSFEIINQLISDARSSVYDIYMFDDIPGLYKQRIVNMREEYYPIPEPLIFYTRLKEIEKTLLTIGNLTADEAIDYLKPYIKELEKVIGD